MTVTYIQIGAEPPAIEMAFADYLLGNTAAGDTSIFTKTQILTGALGEAQGIYGNDGASKIEINDGGTAITITPATGGGTTVTGNLAVTGGLKVFTKAGVPADGDFTNPANGMLAIDTSASKLYMRIGGAWIASAAFT